MKPPALHQPEKSELFLSVSYKAGEMTENKTAFLYDSVITTNTKFYITGFNKAAETHLGLTEKHKGRQILSEALHFKFKNTTRFRALLQIFKTGCWSGEIIFTSAAGEAIHYTSTATLINNDSTIVISNKKNIINNQAAYFAMPHAIETLFGMFMENSQTGCWIYDENNYVIFANKSYSEVLYTDEDPTGKHLTQIFPEKLAQKLIARNKAVLENNKPVISDHKIISPDGTAVHFVSHAFAFETTDKKRFVGGQAINITDTKNTQAQMEKMHERFTHAVNATSEAIWDLDLKTNEIYRSDAFYKISGYSKEELANNLDWWFDKIHPDDKARVKKNFTQDLLAGKKNWADEYRFQYADGTYRFISDKGFAVNEDGKPVRLIGAIRDVTEQKQLEKQLINEQVKKQKLINQATIEAQEKERGMISAELHDNVNQLLMSARLHIGAAKNNDNQTELLDKASAYLLEAVEEIRALSKRLNTSIVKAVGLEQSILDICRNMKQFNDITVTTTIDQNVVDKLTQEQQLVIFRITQEQSNNIIKYSRASCATISVTEKNNQSCLIISDNGIGFDKEKQKASGIGFINIFNRVDAYNGKVEIITYPDNGCTLNITIPYII